MRLEPRGTPEQVEALHLALQHCTFPWENYDLERVVPVDFADLSRFVQVAGNVSPDTTGAIAVVGPNEDHPISGTPTSHHHDHERGADPLEVRGRILGLAYYSGRIEVDISLTGEFLAEVLLSELAHMIDFFGMVDRDRIEIWNAVHAGTTLDLPDDYDVNDGIVLGNVPGHDHSWFDIGVYYSWVGEAWMGLFVRSWSDITVTIDFPDHPPSDDAVERIRQWFTPYVPPIPPTPDEPIQPEPIQPAGCLTRDTIRYLFRRTPQ